MEGKRRLAYQLAFPERFLSKTDKDLMLPPLVEKNGTTGKVYLRM